VYDTLCSNSVNSPAGRTCSEHPVDKQHLQKRLPTAGAR
jgi:hypothetical protein